MGSQKGGRKRGSRNRGYFYRKGRGWCATGGMLLRHENGEPIREQRTPQPVLHAAYMRSLAAKRQPAVEETGELDGATVETACKLYLDHAKANGADSTYRLRADSLFDFCSGLPAEARGKPKLDRAKIKPIHAGYGKMLVRDLKPLHVDQWVAAHKWAGGKRTKVQAIKRALSYGVEAGFLSRNPLKGYSVSRSNIRKTYITPEQEEALYSFAKPALKVAIKVCIRTGARYGCEFAKLTAKHVQITDKGMEWRFSANESKTGRQTGKERIIRIPNSEKTACEVIAIVERQIKLHPEGILFRNDAGEPWEQVHLGGAFRRLKKRLAKQGIKLDDGACMYSCRHTYAKRTLNGFWSGKQTTIEVLAGLMGNSRQVCWEHYADWCDQYTDPLWASA